ncbi:MAG: M20/M25/M40 family metallo-hydrolase [Clostridia bacterium]|nr:M20/M25/M40 family metallo-hydrolase [Clostridia bacterium]
MDFQQFILENKNYLYQTLKELCLIPAPSHNEGKRAEYCKEWLKKNGCKGVYVDSALNVIFPLNVENSDSITVYAAHTDTVFPDLEPLPSREEDGKIFCPGVGDDTASVCVLMMGAKYCVENNLHKDGGILFVMNSCEEGLGNLKGTRQLFKDYKGRIKQFITLDSGLCAMANVSVGSHRYKVDVKTPGGHSYGAFGNKNAIVEISKIAAKIYEIEVPVREDSKTTYNVGTIEGGTSVNTIAENASMLCEYRSTNRECLEIMRQSFEKIFKDADCDDVKVSVEKVGDRPCADIDKSLQDCFTEKMKSVIESVLGKELRVGSSSTDCNIPLSMGIPSLAIGVRAGGGVHTRDEWIEKNSIIKGMEIFLNVLTKI